MLCLNISHFLSIKKLQRLTQLLLQLNVRQHAFHIAGLVIGQVPVAPALPGGHRESAVGSRGERASVGGGLSRAALEGLALLIASHVLDVTVGGHELSRFPGIILLVQRCPPSMLECVGYKPVLGLLPGSSLLQFLASDPYSPQLLQLAVRVM